VNRELLLTKIESAKRDITAAEHDLESAVRDLGVTVEKTTITKVLEDAFAKLRAARTDLLDLERLVVGED
jgi:hypothetical protein